MLVTVGALAQESDPERLDEHAFFAVWQMCGESWISSAS